VRLLQAGVGVLAKVVVGAKADVADARQGSVVVEMRNPSI
jgi:hypothetical protein